MFINVLLVFEYVFALIVEKEIAFPVTVHATAVKLPAPASFKLQTGVAKVKPFRFMLKSPTK